MTVNGKPDASLRVWKDFFPYAKIYGGDIDSDTLFTEDRILTYHVDQFDNFSIKNMWSKINGKILSIF